MLPSVGYLTQHSASVTTPSTLKLIHTTPQLVAGVPVQITLSVTNRRPHRRRLVFELQTQQMVLRTRLHTILLTCWGLQVGVLLNGVSGQSLGELQPGEQVEVPIDMLPMQPGIQKIGGVDIVDEDTYNKIEFQELGEILVMQQSATIE